MRLLPLLLIAGCAGVHAQATPSRGQLLYTTHCIECHSTQMHWRDARRARDWDTLRTWVRHWAGESRLQWTEEDVDAVARYLDESVYKFGRLAVEGSATPTLVR
ncbi:cytochrome c [Ramlibacter alkalitolerans]|uniref:Cytochrome c n=2 Tax=Ramlibacter alkalitolerans TaxID=2039631 RepID=A0ABS1JX26_9BURK|nr:cytochrome c [Ramlibacter alkalitolerans]